MKVPKQWIYSKKNNKNYKKQQLLKALKLSYINRKKKVNKRKNFSILYNLKKKLNNNIKSIKFYNINFNWLLKNKYLN